MFDLTSQEWDKVAEWTREQDLKVTRTGNKYGDVCGALTYSFTPTTLGTVIKVRHAVTNEELNLAE